MDNIALLPSSARKEVFLEASAQLGVVPAIVEKDFWVSWTLGKLFSNHTLSKQLMFKGGTSLSKIYKIIDRFSEDIDLILNWQQLTSDDPMLQGSKTKDDKSAKSLNELAKTFIATELLTEISLLLSSFCACELDSDPYVINVKYPAAFDHGYLRPEIRLEIGPMAAWTPHETKQISCMVTGVFPHLLLEPLPKVNVISAERTFWEKATILHAECFRSEAKPQPARYSRHYYDLFKLIQSDIKSQALSNIALLEQVVDFKRRFYQCKTCNYDLAKVGTLKLVPPEHILKAVRHDYKAMKEMIYGDYPSFDEILVVLINFEDELNGVLV
jgi:predicted nucleotidyltransferase component of viral defense system